MPLTLEAKEHAKEVLRQQLNTLKIETFERWRYLMEADEHIRKCSGYSKGTDDMLKKLTKEYQKAHDALLKPFDRGDYD